MKKFLLIICTILLLAVLGALFVFPYCLGFIAQNKYVQILDTFSKSSAVQITLLDYQRGWFSSEATIKVISQFTPKLATTVTPPLIIKQKIEHGPIFSLTSDQGKKSLLLGQGLITSHIESTFGVVDVVSWIKLDGALWGTMHAPTLYFANPQANQYITVNDGLSGIFKLPANMKQFAANFSVPQVVIKTGKLEQRIDQIDIYYDLQKSVSGIFLGQRAFTVRSMVWDMPLYPSKLKFDGLNVRFYDEEQNHRINDEINIELQQIAANNASYGPQRIVLAINQLDTPALLTLKKEFNKLHYSGDFSGQALTKYQQLFVVLLSKGFEIQLKKLQIVTPWGNPSLVANITLPAQSTVDNDFMSLFGAINITAEANTPATFLIRVLEKFYAATQDTQVAIGSNIDNSKIAQQQVSDWVNKRWLLPKDNGYQINILYQNQHTIINGQPLNASANVQNAVISSLSNNNICKNVQRLS